MNVTQRQLTATQAAIRKIAYHTAQGKDQRAKDAQAHCKELGIDWTKRSCRNCGEEFQPTTRGQDCCSSECRVQLRTFSGGAA